MNVERFQIKKGAKNESVPSNKPTNKQNFLFFLSLRTTTGNIIIYTKRKTSQGNEKNKKKTTYKYVHVQWSHSFMCIVPNILQNYNNDHATKRRLN